MSTLEEYLKNGGATTIYPPFDKLDDPPEGYTWKPKSSDGKVTCLILQELPKKGDCNCR